MIGSTVKKSVRAARTFVKQAMPADWQPHAITGNWIASRTKGRVASGPFQGMAYVNRAVGSHYFPKVLGTYEKELHFLINTLALDLFGQIVNVGAGEGYYAVGLARRNPNLRVVAFETEVEGRDLIRSLAELNAVEDRVGISGTCNTGELNAVLDNERKSFLIVDIEGGEESLLQPTTIGGLKKAYILVEVHNFIKPRIDLTLMERFGETHLIRQIPAVPRSISDFPLAIPFPMSLIPRVYFEDHMGERPHGMSWLYLEPRQ